MTDIPAAPLFNFDGFPPFEQPADATPEKPKEAEKYQRLSRILKPIPAAECHLILKNWDTAILAGTIRAVPYKAHSFNKAVINEEGQEMHLDLQDELVEMTHELETWLNQQREEARYAVLPYHGEIATTPDRLKRAEDDFERLLQARVQRLQGSQGARKASRK